MESTGRYVVRYEPSDSRHEYLQTRIEMSISDEATFDDMANFFDAFLKAAGFVYDGSLKVIDEEQDQSPWSITTRGSQGTDFVPLRSLGNDVISFGGK